MLKKVFSRGTALALTLAALVSPLTAAAAWQYTDYAYVRVFYTDASRQQVAGRETWYCDGTTESYGEETSYFQYYNGMCP